jgi:hypothetical protein
LHFRNGVALGVENEIGTDGQRRYMKIAKIEPLPNREGKNL